MYNSMTVICHSESDANAVINSLNDEQLRSLMLITFVDNIAYSVYLDMYKGSVITTCYPYAIKANKPLSSCFRDAIFAIYHDNFL